MERIFLLIIGRKSKHERSRGDMEEEMRELVYSSRGNVIETLTVMIDKPTPNYYIGQGKVLEIKARVQSLKPHAIVANVDLSPVQARNISQMVGRKVIDRTGLILDIFAQHARSREGKIQIELAQLMYLLPRISEIWEKFSRLGGGIGTRGPGEQILEYDRRRIRKRIAKLKKDMEQLETHRTLARKNRQRRDCTVISIVGYTNAGKSTLLRSITGADVLVEDKMFATLDPVTRRYQFPDGRVFLFTDTVGLLLDLPQMLLEAFRPTLEEVAQADIMLVLLDGSDPHVKAHYEVVMKTVRDVGAHEKDKIVVINKVDLISPEIRRELEHDFPEGLFVSAEKGAGIDSMLAQIRARVVQNES